MSCFSPLLVKRDLYGNFKFIGGVNKDNQFEVSSILRPDLVPVPCGRCEGCRLDRSKAWADRMLLELKSERDGVSPHACFLTLTYDDEHLHFVPSSEGVPLATLNKRDVVLFNKRLRRLFAKFDRKLRFYYAGEYGDDTFRPHVHEIVFGMSRSDFTDAFLYSTSSETGTSVYESDTLNAKWSHGAVRFNDANYQTFCYVARYVIKKQYGNDGKIYYDGRLPPFNGMSRNPGLGSDFFDGLDVTDRRPVFDGKEVRLISAPRCVLDKIRKSDPERYENIKSFRRRLSQSNLRLLLSNTDKPWLDYLHDSQMIFVQKHRCLTFRKKV